MCCKLLCKFNVFANFRSLVLSSCNSLLEIATVCMLLLYCKFVNLLYLQILYSLFVSVNFRSLVLSLCNSLLEIAELCTLLLYVVNCTRYYFAHSKLFNCIINVYHIICGNRFALYLRKRTLSSRVSVVVLYFRKILLGIF